MLLAAGGCAVLIDLGLPVSTALKETLAELRQRRIKLLGALITHSHGDHFAPGPLRAMAGLDVPVFAPRHAIDHATEQLRIGFWSGRPEFRCIDDGEGWERPFTLGPFHISPHEVTHSPEGTCLAFEMVAETPGGGVRLVHATDLCDPRGLPPALIDADLIYIESNHDPELLRLHPNPASRFHLPNARCGKLLESARRASARPPAHVCLGHLSERRNTPTLAEAAVREAFASAGTVLDFPLVSAPRHHPGRWIELDTRR